MKLFLTLFMNIYQVILKSLFSAAELSNIYTRKAIQTRFPLIADGRACYKVTCGTKKVTRILVPNII